VHPSSSRADTRTLSLCVKRKGKPERGSSPTIFRGVRSSELAFLCEVLPCAIADSRYAAGPAGAAAGSSTFAFGFAILRLRLLLRREGSEEGVQVSGLGCTTTGMIRLQDQVGGCTHAVAGKTERTSPDYCLFKLLLQ